MSASKSFNNNNESEPIGSESESFRGFNCEEREKATTNVFDLLGNGLNCNCCGELKTSNHSAFICKICCLGFKTVEDMTQHLIRHHNACDHFQDRNVQPTLAMSATTAEESIGRRNCEEILIQNCESESKSKYPSLESIINLIPTTRSNLQRKFDAVIKGKNCVIVV